MWPRHGVKRCIGSCDLLDPSARYLNNSAREIAVVHHFELAGRHFLATAGEDTVIKVHEVDGSGRRSECVSLKSHISCVKSVKTLQLPSGGGEEVVMVSAGGRAQLKVWRVRQGGGYSALG